MKKRRILALALSAGMLIGQASYAYGTEVPNKTVKNETDITYDIENDTELSGDNGQSDTEQIEEFSEENITDNSQLMLSTFTYDEEDGNSVGENTGAAEENILTDAEVYSSPDDEVVIKDETLRNILINKYYYDEDLGRNVYFSEDGYISVKEMESLTELSIYGNVSISDLTGLEYAVNLEILEFNGIDLHGLTSIEPLRGLSKMRRLSLNETGLTDISALEGLTNLESLYLRNNTGIKDISPLAGLSSLHFLVLSGCSQLATIKPIYGLLNNSLSYLIISDTAVPAQERMDVFCEMELASLPSSLILGDSIRIYHIENYLNSTSEFYVSSVGGDSESINISDEGNCIEIAPQVTGDIVIQFSIDDVTLEYPISVEGFSTGDMTLGESVDYTVDYITQKNGWNTSTILISNGELWDLYPEATCKKKNVKSYVSDWIYSGSDAVLAEYVLDYDNVLWSDETRIADNIQKYDGHYALTTDNVLIDIYNDQSIRLEGVCDWIQEISTEYNESGEPLKSTTTYVLKQDGTLWSREEVEKSAAVNQFEKIADGVVQLFDDQYNDYYLADDGKYYYFNGTETSYSRNFDDDGNLCLGGQVIGKFNIKEFYDHFYYMYFLTEEGEFYRWYFTGGAGGGSGVWTGGLVLADVEEVSRDVDLKYICKTADGTYYRISGSEATAVDEYQLDWLYDETEYDLMFDTVTGDKRIERNGVVLLDHIITAWEADFFLEDGSYEDVVYAIRTDGTVWIFKNRSPVKFADLNDTGIELGNLNEDGDINVADLMMCLQYVSGRNELTGNSLLAADINEDGSVDVVDLMRLLHYVSGRNSSL